MTEFLVIKSKDTNFEDFKNYLPTAGEGTLKNRMLYFKDNLKAKTGTLSDTSAIAGYLTSRKGKTYAFDIMTGEGTLKNRMLYFKDNLKAKTGTLSDTSAIAGYLTSRKGKTYAFDIMINDAKSTPADKKNLEEQVLRLIYTNY